MRVNASADRRPLSIVLADPVREIRQAYGDYLIASGCQVAFASDSDAALVQAVSLQPDAIIIGHRLRPLAGPRFCARLKTAPETAAIPVTC